MENFVYWLPPSPMGMGVDVRGVNRAVICGQPSDLDDYVQMSGRIGRDGTPSIAATIKYPGCSSWSQYHFRNARLPERRSLSPWDRSGTLWGNQEYTCLPSTVAAMCVQWHVCVRRENVKGGRSLKTSWAKLWFLAIVFARKNCRSIFQLQRV